MEQIRVIIQSTENGSRESVIFTDDFDLPIDDFVIPGFTVDCDKVIEDNLPDGFPKDYNLERN